MRLILSNDVEKGEEKRLGREIEEREGRDGEEM